MKILAIDPGPELSAAVIFDGTNISFKTGKHRGGYKNKWPNRWILNYLTRYQEENPVVVIEMVACYGMPAGKSLFDTARWVGRFQQHAENLGLQHELIYRKDVKMNLCNSMKAKDGNIRQALIDRFGQPGTKMNPGTTHGLAADTWAAFAVAVTYWDTKVQK